MNRAVHRLLAAALFAVVLAVVSHTRADPDLWGHVRFGHDTVAARAVATADPYSFASDRPWVNHEWLAEILMYAAYAAAAGPGLAILKVLIVGGMLWIAVGAWPSDLPPRVRLLLIGALVIGTIPQANHVRPQLFSLLLFAVLLRLLLARGLHLAAQALLVASVFALWVNLHGGWIVGGGVLAVWVAGAVLWGRHVRSPLAWIAIGAAAAMATLVNPYGWHLWTFLWSTVGLSREQISDWEPVYVLGTAYLAIWLLIAGLAAGLAIRQVRAKTYDPTALAIVVLLAWGSFRVNRLLAFFAIAVVMLLARPWIRAGAAPRVAPRAEVAPSAASVVIAAGLAIVMLAGALTVSAGNLACVRIDEATYPEPQATAALRAARIDGRMLTYFDWGEYAIWHLPGVSVSLDGRRETVDGRGGTFGGLGHLMPLV